MSYFIWAGDVLVVSPREREREREREEIKPCNIPKNRVMSADGSLGTTQSLPPVITEK